MDVDAGQFAQAVVGWYRQHGRSDLPWQQDKTGYRVWLSEIMLQQTQVATVIPFYERFLQRFPTLRTLADAPIDDVLQYWQGLGYYARARNLHRSAQTMRDEHSACFPRQFDQAVGLPGVGRSTAAAILTFVYGQSWPILDGNVKRVLARCFRVPGWYGQSTTMKRLWQLSEALTPDEQTDAYNQGMMDIGATLCLRSRPNCGACPLTYGCESYQHETQHLYPEKKPRRQKPHKHTLMLLHRCNGEILLERRPDSGIWGGLWSLPEVEDREQIGDWQARHLQQEKPPVDIRENLMKHQFTHYSLDISLAIIDIEQMSAGIADGDRYRFIAPDALPDYGLPTPVRRLLEQSMC